MQTEPTVIASYVKTLTKTLDQLGIEYRSCMPDGWSSANTDTRVPLSQINAFWHALVSGLTDKSIGLQVALNIHPSSFHLVGQLAQHCHNLEQAWDAAIRYYSLVSEAGTLTSSIHDQHLILTFTPHSLIPSMTSQQLEAMMGALIQYALFIMEGDFHISLVQFKHQANAEKEVYADVFGENIEFSCSNNRIHIPLSELSKKIPLASDVLRKHHLEAIEESLLKHNQTKRPEDELIFKVYEYLRSKLPAPLPSLDQCADDLHLSPSTLKRKLKKHNITYSDISKRVRKDIVFQLLQDHQIPITTIAYQVGFSNPTTFYRSFKNWTGMTPADYRKRKAC